MIKRIKASCGCTCHLCHANRHDACPTKCAKVIAARTMSVIEVETALGAAEKALAALNMARDYLSGAMAVLPVGSDTQVTGSKAIDATRVFADDLKLVLEFVRSMPTPKSEGSKVIRTWPSSKPGKFYELMEGTDGVVYCTCPAWKFSKNRPRECKHMEQWAMSVATGGKAFAIDTSGGRR